MIGDRENLGRPGAVELKDLRWALVASRHRSLRRAADALNVRQSTLSRRLRDLEFYLGAELFERTNAGTRPTMAGLELLKSARQILDETDAAFRHFKDRSRGEHGHLTIGIYASATTGNMHATLSDHHRRFPNVDIRMVDGSLDKLLRALAANTVDVAIMNGCWARWDDRMLPLWSERVIVGLPRNHPLRNRQTLCWMDLSDEPILLTENGPGPELERLLMTRLRPAPVRRVLYHESALDRLFGLVTTGHGMMLMLEGGTGLHCDGVIYRELHDDNRPIRMNFAAYWREANTNPTLPVFLDLLRERYPDLSECQTAS